MSPELSHNDHVFRVLLQRETFRSSLTFSALESALPKAMCQLIAATRDRISAALAKPPASIKTES